MTVSILTKKEYMDAAKNKKDLGDLPVVKADSIKDIHELADNLPKGHMLVVDFGG